MGFLLKSTHLFQGSWSWTLQPKDWTVWINLYPSASKKADSKHYTHTVLQPQLVPSHLTKIIWKKHLRPVWGILSIIVLYLASLQSQKPPEFDPVRELGRFVQGSKYVQIDWSTWDSEMPRFFVSFHATCLLQTKGTITGTAGAAKRPRTVGHLPSCGSKDHGKSPCRPCLVRNLLKWHLKMRRLDGSKETLFRIDIFGRFADSNFLWIFQWDDKCIPFKSFQ